MTENGFDKTKQRRRALLRALGPGLIMAGAAVGVSHLVQATRAGAEYGFLLLGLVLIACLLKYPFLEFGPRYTAATGESLLSAYRRLGRWALGLYTLVTLSTMFAILGSVTIVTAGLAARLAGPELGTTLWSALVLGTCAIILAIGRFRGLDLAMKLVMGLLAILTTLAVGLALGTPAHWENLDAGPSPSALWSAAGIAFILALLGWMPIPLDVAAWNSLWTRQRSRQTGEAPSLRHALIDFRIGYIGASILAALFLILGALVMYGSGESFAADGVRFSGQLANLYAATLGDWIAPVILITAFTVMFSTTLAVTDAYPRVLGGLAAFLIPEWETSRGPIPRVYFSAMLLVTGGALAVIHFANDVFTVLVDFATTVSFLTAPILAWLNLLAVRLPGVPEEARPGPGLLWLSWTGIVFLVGFSLVWAGWRLFG